MEEGNELDGEPAAAQGETKSSADLAEGSSALIHTTALALCSEDD